MSRVKISAIIVIGNEILSGRTHDINTQFLAQELAKIGIKTIEVRIIPDIEDVIINTILSLKDRVDYVFTTGGIGSTHDDITSAAIAKLFGRELVLNEEAVELLEGYYGYGNLIGARMKMAMIPDGAELIYNQQTAAPGFRIDNVFVLAGVPKIMQVMFHGIADSLDTGYKIAQKTLTINISESRIADSFEMLQKKYPDIEMGSYPSLENEGWITSLCLSHHEEALLERAFQDLNDMIKKIEEVQ